MKEFYKTPAGRRFIDETVPNLVYHVARLATALEKATLIEQDNEVVGGPKINLPHSPVHGMGCRFIAHLEDGSAVVQLNPVDVYKIFEDRDYRRAHLQDPWGGFVWFDPQGFYFAVPPSAIVET